MHLFNFPLRRILLYTAFSTVVCGAALAQGTNQKLPTDPDVVVGKLENGLTYYIRNNHKPANKVELRLVVKAGSILENESQQGLAHFMEHMNFNGTKNFQKNDLVSYLQSIGVQFGADLNAYTSFDQTVYILPIPTDKKENLEKGFQIIEDWSSNALLTDKDIDEERAVVLEESRLGKGADDRMLKKYFPKLAGGSLYADRLPIGKDDILKNFKHETIRDYYKEWYRPDLQAVVVVGDIDVATAKKMIEQHFAGHKNPAKEKERKYVDIAPRKAPEAMVVTDKEATSSSFTIAFPFAKKHDAVTVGDYKKSLVKSLAIQMINLRLNDLAQGSNPPFPYAGIGFDDMVHGYESLNVFALFDNNGPQKAMDAVTGELVRAQKYGFTESELELAKKELVSAMEKGYNERNTTDSKNYVEEYIRAFLDKEPIPGIANEYNYYKTLLPAIKATDANQAFNSWFSNMNTFTLITAPDKKDIKLPNETELLAMAKNGFNQQIGKTEEKAVATELMKTRPAPGKVISQVKEAGLDATTYTLSNGIKITIKPTDFKSDEIIMSGTKRGGSNGYPLADRSNVHFATEIVDAMGVGEFTPNDLEKVTAGKTIRVDMGINEINDAISASSTVKDFESMLQLANLYMVQPRKDEGLFNAYKDKQETMIQFMSSNPRAAFADTTVKALYQNNPMARMVIPQNADFDKIKLDRVLEIYKNEFSTADGYHFFIVGNINPETALPLLETYLGSIPSANKPAVSKDNGVRTVKGTNELKIKKGKEKQSLIMAIYSGEVPYSEDLALKTQALTEVLNIKVIEELREKMGAIYGGGFNSSVAKEPYERYSIQLQLPCGPENVDKLLTAADDEIKSLKDKGPETKDLDKVKSQWHEKHVTDVKENTYWIGKLEAVLFWDRDKNRVLDFDTYIQQLTPADIQNTAKLLFNGNNKFVSILYPES